MFSALSFGQPLLLLALIGLPILWLILRAIPPAAKRLRFAAVLLLLGLKDKQTARHGGCSPCASSPLARRSLGLQAPC